MKTKLLPLIVVFVTTFFTSCTTDVEPLHETVNLDTCVAPSFFQASDFINEASINLSWVATDNQSSWQVSYGVAGFAVASGTMLTSNTTNLTINELSPLNNYEFYVRSVCGADLFSGWVGPISVNSSIMNCPYPTALSYIRLATTPTEATLIWTAGESETSWEIQYGTSGFTIGTGTTVVSNTVTEVVSGLQPNTAYDFYVRAVCSASEKSAWAGPMIIPSVSGGGGPGANGVMTANINGTQYNQMKPFFYPIEGGSYAFISELSPDVLQIQGNTAPLDPSFATSYEINILIPRDLWEPGTYAMDTNTDLQSEEPITACYVSMNLPQNTDYIANEETGTITITEFNFTTRRVKGTFSFSYMASSAASDEELGPLQVTNGTFDFLVNPEDILD